MKHSALAGVFITAAMLASPAFAAGKTDQLCQINLDKINNGKALLATDTTGKAAKSTPPCLKPKPPKQQVMTRGA